jgi:hypothetical protein
MPLQDRCTLSDERQVILIALPTGYDDDRHVLSSLQEFDLALRPSRFAAAPSVARLGSHTKRVKMRALP